MSWLTPAECDALVRSWQVVSHALLSGGEPWKDTYRQQPALCLQPTSARTNGSIVSWTTTNTVHLKTDASSTLKDRLYTQNDLIFYYENAVRLTCCHLTIAHATNCNISIKIICRSSILNFDGWVLVGVNLQIVQTLVVSGCCCCCSPPPPAEPPCLRASVRHRSDHGGPPLLS